MHTQNYKERIQLYLKSNPKLTAEQLGTLMSIDSIYRNFPDDLDKFRELYAHLDPAQIDGKGHSIQLVNIANSNEPDTIIKHRLNAYINMKYNYLGHSKSYEENMVLFRKHSSIISAVVSDILEASGLSSELMGVFSELESVKECNDFYDMLQLYRKSDDPRIKFEILRKIGLIVLLSRILRTFIVDEFDYALEKIKRVFYEGMGLRKQKSRNYYLWVDENEQVQFENNKRIAIRRYQEAVSNRQDKAMKIHPMQVFEYTPHKTRFNSRIVHMEFRNKFRDHGWLSYSSFIEKMVRKNLEFPNEIHDVLGIKLVVLNEDQIPQLVMDLQSFLGGSSTRKKEKNTFSKFGKRKLGKYSSDDYFVWKAIYDIALPHPSIEMVMNMISMTKNNREAQKVLKRRVKYFKNRPMDFVVEVQLQDINSYLLSIAKGSTTDHEVLKQKQIMGNSFYKLFPKEIYEKELILLRKRILSRVRPRLPPLHPHIQP